MAANMDAMLRIAAKVQGLNDFKALSDRLVDVEQASGNTKARFQQLATESGRLANEAVRSGQSIQRAANNIRELGVVLAPTDDLLAKVREEMLALGAGSKVTERSLNQQIQALKTLQSQAAIGGAVYRQLGKDIKALGGAYQEAATGAKVFSDAQRASQIAGAKPGTFNAQIGALKNQLQELSVYGGEYAAKLAEIQRRQLSFNTAIARQGVIADAAAFAQGGKNAGQALPELPNTTAGLSQRLSELNTKLVNVTLGGRDWIRVSREIANVQRQLNQEFDKGSTQYRSPIGPQAPSALFQRIAGISDQAGANQLQLMGRSYGEVAESIQRASAASDGSINSLQRQRAAWQALQSAVNPASPAYERARKSAAELDAQIKKLTATQQKAARAGVGRAAIGSALGSLAAGGGFQGAAGALAGGLAFSGGAGALAAGGAITGIGAIGALAARVGVTSETAQVRLKALTEQFGEYNQAQAAAARIAATLRISQTEATDSFSKLYGALRPTGVTLQEVEDAFIGFTAAARASGATASESSAALLQLKQALGSGVLQGDELRSIREQAPAAAQAIAREMGVTIGELKKLGSEGKITTDIVLRALARLKGESLEKLNAQFGTSAQALQDLRVSTEQFGTTIARVFGPAAVATVRGLGAAIREVNAVMGALTGDGGAQGRVVDMQRARTQAQQDTNRRPFGLFDAQGKQGFFQQRTQQLFQQFQRQRAEQAERAAVASGASRSQLAERQAAERERQLGRQRASAGGSTAAQSNLNQLLIENLRLNTELGNVGKDRISQLNAEIELIPQVLKLQLSVLNASVKGKDLQQSRINAITEARTRSAQLEEELQGVNKEISSIANQAASLRVSTLSGLLPKGSPLQEEVRKVKEDLLAADDAAAELLSRLSGLAGTNPSGAAARAAIGNLRGDVASADPGAIASQRLLQGDTDALRQQITELQNAGRELSTLEQLAMKYGAEWDQIDPKIRASVGALAQQRDQLQELNKEQERNKQLAEGIAGTIGGGIGSAFDQLIDGTANWGNSLRSIAAGVLQDIARQLVQILVVEQAIVGIRGVIGGLFPGGGAGLGGSAANLAQYAPLSSFAGGGYTGNAPRTGGMDGRGGFMAMLHPQETVIDHARAMPRQGAANPINVVVNVDAKGSQVEGSQTEGAALGRVISAAVRAELVKQQLPNGILGGGRR